jgi:hypothetical protein
VPVGHKGHGGVAVAVAVALGRVHELLDLGLRQVLAGAQVWRSFRPLCSPDRARPRRLCWLSYCSTRVRHSFKQQGLSCRVLSHRGFVQLVGRVAE